MTSSGFGVSADPWVAFQPALDAMLEPLGEAVLARLAPGNGDRVLDVGCGCGSTSLALAALVGPSGSVTGIDIAPSLLAVATATAMAVRRAGGAAAPLSFVEADATTYPFPPNAFDVIFSRFGTMFFAEPEAAFANLRRALRRGGQLGFVCWRELERNRWASEPRGSVAAIIGPAPAPNPGTPGPFSLSSSDRILELLTTAGFVRVEIEPHDQPILIGRGSVDEAVAFFLRLLPTGYLMIEPDRHALDRIKAALRTVLERHHTEAGIWMGSSVWIVRAR